MARKSETSELALPPSLQIGLTVEGYSEEGGTAANEAVRLHMHSGSNEDQARWPDAKAGDWIDGLDGTNYGQSVKFAPLAAFMSFAVWQEGSKIPVLSTLNRADINPADLRFGPAGEKPRCVESFNYIGVIEGAPYCYRLQFKRTGFKVGETIKQLQARRDQQGSGPGLYLLDSTPQKNKAGQTYRQVAVKPAGNLNGETLAAAAKIAARLAMFAEKARAAAKAESEAEVDHGNGETEIPV